MNGQESVSNARSNGHCYSKNAYGKCISASEILAQVLLRVLNKIFQKEEKQVVETVEWTEKESGISTKLASTAWGYCAVSCIASISFTVIRNVITNI